MDWKTRGSRMPAMMSSLLVLFAMGSSFAAEPPTQNAKTSKSMVSPKSDTFKDANEQVRESVKVVRQMEKDSGMKSLLQQAKGVFIVPHYARVALGVGGRGGEGILLVKQGQNWSDPAFYNFGAVSAGAEAGIEAGSIALILNNDKAVQSFKQDNNFSLNADAGLTIINWSKKGQASAGKGDVVVWADTEGFFGDLAVGVSDINFDENETKAFFGKAVTANDVLSGKAKAPAQRVAMLKRVLPSAKATMSGGSSEQKPEKK